MDTQATQVNTADGSAVEWIEPAAGQPAPMPQQGGSYIRLPDGSLVLEHRTEDNAPAAVPVRPQEA
jgi:gentisate 1,2-dioxygenase